ncbi:hypothetical protein BGZ96_012430 [Linnemannia gamsii]|uniref:Uncharacterized protein n=1 Tax=Linnemannia gamsii TaxID=64522 RepID=A0ABQ7KBF6_9FUNG|nr:hypothetical protein BGZ96_012430 [Linnemannia gamsii]
MSAQTVAAASAKTAPQPAIAEITYPTDTELQECVKVFAQTEEFKTLGLHGKKKQQHNKHSHHHKSMKTHHGKKGQSEHHHHHQKRDELVVAHTALDTQDQKEAFQSPEEALSILSDLAAGSDSTRRRRILSKITTSTMETMSLRVRMMSLRL